MAALKIYIIKGLEQNTSPLLVIYAEPIELQNKIAVVGNSKSKHYLRIYFFQMETLFIAGMKFLNCFFYETEKKFYA